jgi:hypothetical protein
MLAPPASGVTKSEAAAAGVAATVCISDTAVGMVLPTNHAVVTPISWTPLKMIGVPPKPSSASRSGPTGVVFTALLRPVKMAVGLLRNDSTPPSKPCAGEEAAAAGTAAAWVAAAAGLAVGDAGVSG